MASTTAFNDDAMVEEDLFGTPRRPSRSQTGQTRLAFKHSDTPEETEVLGSQVDIPEDAYGAAILAIIKEVAEIRSDQTAWLSYVRCLFALALLCANVTLQALVLYFLSTYVVGPQVRHIQKCYRRFHKEVFDHDGNFQEDLWEDYEGKDELCQIPLTNRTFLYSLLLLWTASMMVEFRTGERLMRAIYRMPRCRVGSEMLEVDSSNTSPFVVALTKHTRWVLYATVCIPKILICALLLRLGWRWLLATTSFEELIMNTVAMEFVIHIDELLYGFAVPQTYQRLVKDINFFIPEDAKTQKNVDSDEWIGYVRSGTYVAVTFFLVIIYVEFVQDLLPPGLDNIQEHCREFYSRSNGPICPNKWLDGRLFVRMEDCFPYGEDDGS